MQESYPRTVGPARAFLVLLGQARRRLVNVRLQGS